MIEKELDHIIKSLIDYGVKLRKHKDELKNVLIEHIRYELIESVDKEIELNKNLLTKLYEKREQNK